ncbi:hypothetical protein [Allopontixanthobacter sediminis]|uniref:Uncharacterized protein n=1 Tax=Allopontixanthobacter sediminis TaxID=1689985 RepID=A0A845ATG1_9SPHN|nr:hypothetical protein [Allopontixanthobacter sediminis]MXP42843.1 hypothetical protein [Allopontixanthobacter sediminis]
MSAPDIPTNYTITQTINPLSIGTTLAGGMRTELAGGMRTELAGGIRTEMAGGVSVTLLGDENKPIATKMDVGMTMRNLPNFDKQDIFDLIAALKEMKTRVRMPVDLSFGLSVFPLNLFNVNVLQFRICGEPQVIVDDYVPNAYERCATECEPCD